MKVILEAIKFNHDPGSAANDGINIRKNEKLFVNVPEWQSGVSVNPEDSTAAYALCETRGNVITIQAKIRCTDPKVEAIEVRAVDARITAPSPAGLSFFGVATWLARPLLRRLVKNVLGDVQARYVFPCEGETDFETFTLKNVRIWEEGVGVHDIAWRWQYRLSGNNPWTDFEVTRHRIYAILRLPTYPWRQKPYEPSNTQLPWAEVLDYACNWASSARLVDDAASRITERVYNLGRSLVKYSGDDHYTAAGGCNFDCTAFLERLSGGSGNGVYVNCTDCATIVSSFANVLGCDLWQSTMTTFLHNPVKKIGESFWSSTPRFFSYHEVAWEAECDKGNDVYDACLQVDGDENPSEAPHSPLLVANYRFGSGHDGLYHDRLVAPSNPDGGQPEPFNRQRRAIGKRPLVPGKKCVNKNLLERLAVVHGFQSWRDLNLLEANLFINNFIVRENCLPDLGLLQIESAEAAVCRRATKSVWQLSDDQRDVRLRFDIFECASLPEARGLVLELLTKIQTDDMTRREYVGAEGSAVGDVLFATPDNTRIIFSRANLVLMLRNVEREITPLLGVARQLDQSIISQPNAEDAKAVEEVGRFHLTGAEPLSSPLSFEAAYLQPSAPDLLEGYPLTYKFFSDTGKVFRQGKHLAYQPSSGGRQLIVIFATNARGDAFRQELEFYVQD